MRKFHWMLALSLLTVLALSGCKSQTPPEDLQPVPFPIGKQVYADGDVRCDGKILGTANFTNNVKL